MDRPIDYYRLVGVRTGAPLSEVFPLLEYKLSCFDPNNNPYPEDRVKYQELVEAKFFFLSRKRALEKMYEDEVVDQEGDNKSSVRTFSPDEIFNILVESSFRKSA